MSQYITQKGINAAQKEDARGIQYEQKKGENLATKEDIKEITSQMETIKNEISFENQRKHDFIQQRTKRLLNILYLTEKLNEYQNVIFYALYDINAKDRLIHLMEQTNATLLSFIHECRVAFVTIDDKDLISRISNMETMAQKYASYMCYVASNASNYLNNYHVFLNLAEKHDSKEIIHNAKESKNALETIRNEYEDEIEKLKKSLYDSQMKYLSKLNILFHGDFHLK